MANIGIYRSFFVPTIVGIALLLTAISVKSWLPLRYFVKRDVTETRDQLAAKVSKMIHPNPSLSPREVVDIQLESFLDEHNTFGVLQCMNFASPSNRLVTGPLDRFGKMVRQPPYSALSESNAVTVGATSTVQGKARVFVSVMAGETLHSFVWVLSKQTAGRYQDCWMTDGVFHVFTSQGSSPAKPAKPDSA